MGSVLIAWRRQQLGLDILHLAVDRDLRVELIDDLPGNRPQLVVAHLV